MTGVFLDSEGDHYVLYIDGSWSFLGGMTMRLDFTYSIYPSLTGPIEDNFFASTFKAPAEFLE